MPSIATQAGSLAVFLVLVTGCAVNPVTGESDFVLMSEVQERQLGARYHQQILTEYEIYQDVRLQSLVSRVGQRVARISHRTELEYHFTLLDSPEVNAFALPGGYVYITRGLLAYLSSEDQLAAVLGHEIGHVTARHSVRQHSTSTVTGLLAAVIGAQAGLGGKELVDVAGTALVRGYGREHELQADQLGADYLAKAGYDPAAIVEVIRVLKNQESHEVRLAQAEGRDPRVYHGLFATHPDNDQRLQEVVGAADSVRKERGRHGADVDFLRALDGLVFGDSETQGVVRQNRYFHRALGITLPIPEGWRIFNAKTHMVAVAPQRDALLQLEMLPGSAGRLPEELLREALGDIPFQNGFTIDGEGRHGYGATVKTRTPFGRGDAQVAVVIVGGTVFKLSAAANQQSRTADHARGIRDAFFGLRPLREDERELAEARRLRVIQILGGQSIEELAKQTKGLDDAVDQLRLLNQIYPSGEPVVGGWLKLIH